MERINLFKRFRYHPLRLKYLTSLFYLVYEHLKSLECQQSLVLVSLIARVMIFISNRMTLIIINEQLPEWVIKRRWNFTSLWAE